MNLSELKFEVDTGRLKDAKDAIEALASAMKKLDSATSNESKTASDSVKNTENSAKAKKKLADATEETTTKLSAAEKVQERVVAKTELLRSGTINLADGLLDLGKGFTTSQATMLANLKVMEASSEIIKTVAQSFKDLNAFSSAKPFDPTVAGLEKLRKETQELIMVNEYMAKGFGLTKEQITALSRDAEALRQQFSQAGKSEAELSAALEKLEKDTISAAQALNTLKAAGAEADRIAKQQAMAMKDQADALRNSFDQLVKIHGWKNQQDDSLYQQDMQNLREYFTEQNTKNEALEKSRESSFRSLVQIHQWKQDQDERMYKQDMQDMRQYYSGLERIANEGEKELARIQAMAQREEIAMKYVQGGASRSTANTAANLEQKGVSQEVINSYVKEANARDVASRAAREHANALRNVEAAEERLFSTVNHLNDGISQNERMNERAALAIGSYERQLRLAGITGEEAARRLQKFKVAQEQVSAMEAKRRGDFVARGIGVQMGDVGVSLASGMNPLTVAIQQSDQIRGLLQQSGLEATQMAGIMQQAFKGIVTSFKDVGIAMGSFVLGGIKSIGESAFGLLGKFDPLTIAVNKFKASSLAASQSTETFARQMAILNAAVITSGAIISSFLLLLGGVAIAMYKNSKATDEMMLKLTTSGATLNMTAKELESFANSSNIAGVSANTLKLSLAELASEGFKNKESLDVLTAASQKYAIVTGKDLVDVMKSYANVAKEPVKELIKLGEATGLVTAATIQQVQSLIESGNTAEAEKIAIEAYAAAQTQAAADIEKNLSPLSLLYIDLKTQASDAWDAISDIANSTAVVDGIRNITRIALGLVTAFGDAIIVARTLAEIMARPFNAEPLFESMKEDLRLWNETAKDRQALLAGENRVGGTGSDGKNTSAEVALQKELLSIREKTFTELEKHNIALAKYEDLRKQANATYADNEEKRKAVLAEIATAEEKELTKFNEKHEAKEKKQNAELNRLKELAAYYNLLAKGESGATEYSQDYLKKKGDLTKLLSSKQISGEAYAFGMNELEQNQPWYKSYIKHQEAIRDQELATKDFTRALEQQQETQLLGIKSSIASIGLTEEQRLVNEALQKVEEDRIKNLERIADLTDRASKAKTMTPEELKNYNKTLIDTEQKTYDERKALIEQNVKDSYAASHSFAAGWDTAFASYVDSAKNAADIGKRVFEGLTNGMADALTEWAMTGKITIKDFANTFIREIIRMQMQQLSASAVNGIFGNLIGAIGGGLMGNISTALQYGTNIGSQQTNILASQNAAFNANGNAFSSSGIVSKFAKGGSFTNSIVNQTTPFMFANGGKFGVMGEAGPEAILPLQRTRGGQLGVVASGSSSPNVTVSVTIASDGSSKTETSPSITGKQFGEAIAAAVQSEIIKQKRNGGLLAA